MIDQVTHWEIPVPLVVRKRTGGYPLTMNARLHFHPKAKLVAQIRESVAWRAKGMRIPPQEHVTVWPCYAPGSQRKIDGPNLAATVKPAVDALQDAGIVPGDDARYVTELPTQLIYDTGPRRAWLVVEAIPRPETEETPR
jgi:crossover junction endodeoxyribonuclease RusA